MSHSNPAEPEPALKMLNFLRSPYTHGANPFIGHYISCFHIWNPLSLPECVPIRLRPFTPLACWNRRSSALVPSHWNIDLSCNYCMVRMQIFRAEGGRSQWQGHPRRSTPCHDIWGCFVSCRAFMVCMDSCQSQHPLGGPWCGWNYHRMRHV